MRSSKIVHCTCYELGRRTRVLLTVDERAVGDGVDAEEDRSAHLLPEGKVPLLHLAEGLAIRAQAHTAKNGRKVVHRCGVSHSVDEFTQTPRLTMEELYAHTDEPIRSN